MAKTMRYHVPADPLLLAAFGKVAIRHGHLEHALRMTMKTLAHLSVEEALDATRYESPANLRRRIRKVARRKLGEGQALLKLEALLERCNRATEKRNIFIHSLWAEELDGDAKLRDQHHQWTPIPTVEELEALADRLFSLANEIHEVRLNGWLAEAASRVHAS